MTRGIYKHKPHSDSTKEKIRMKKIGKPFSGKIYDWKGKKQSSEHIEKRIVHMRGEKNPAWKGGVTKEHHKLRNSKEYRIWRNAVLERDGKKCIWCRETKNLHADHIKRFIDYPELRFAIDNGRTLCARCHRTTYKLK